MYSTSDYNSTTSHPPLIGYGLDGFSIYGRYLDDTAPGIEMCGKTGTVQNPHGDDHSVFVAFAPRNNPKIAIAVIVENSGYGATWSAPIASLLVEKYLRDSITRPQAYMDRISNASLLPAVAKPIIKPKIDTLKAKLKAKR